MWALSFVLLLGIDDLPTVSVDELVRIHRTNEALADERFRNKPIVVTGKLESVKRGGLMLYGDKSKQVYHLWMKAADGTSVGFRFTEDERSALAKLMIGQAVHVRGTVEGEFVQNILHLFDARLIPQKTTVEKK